MKPFLVVFLGLISFVSLPAQSGGPWGTEENVQRLKLCFEALSLSEVEKILHGIAASDPATSRGRKFNNFLYLATRETKTATPLTAFDEELNKALSPETREKLKFCNVVHQDTRIRQEAAALLLERSESEQKQKELENAVRLAGQEQKVRHSVVGQVLPYAILHQLTEKNPYEVFSLTALLVTQTKAQLSDAELISEIKKGIVDLRKLEEPGLTAPVRAQKINLLKVCENLLTRWSGE